MSKLYIFGIGGTGARVIKSLTMLLAEGVNCGNFDTIIPLIIDPDAGNGDLTRTINALNLYKSINDRLLKDKTNNSFFFKTKIDDSNSGFRLPITNISDKKFKDYISYLNLDKPNMALISLLFSEKNLDTDMNVGFKGNPNIGSVVLNNFNTTNNSTKSSTIQNVLAGFNQGDRIFIISSIFGGTGAAGFPLLLKNLRNANTTTGFTNPDDIKNSMIGAITVLPYFTIKKDNNSDIDSATFISKTKAALSYYTNNINTDVLYYISDNNNSNQYDNHEGGNEQQDDAHFIEFASALSIIDFALMPSNQGMQPIYKEFATVNNNSTLYLTDLCPSTKKIIEAPMIDFFLFSQYYRFNINKSLSNPWAINKIRESTLKEDFFVNLSNFIQLYVDWLKEMQKNKRSFSPFNVDDSSNIFHSIYGRDPKKTNKIQRIILGKDLDSFKAIDDKMNKISKGKYSYSNEVYFMSIVHEAIADIVKTKFNIY